MSNSMSLGFWRFVSRKGAYFGRVLLSNTNGNSYMGSAMALSDLTLRH